MGTSNWQNISFCVDLIRRISPSSILDVGVGFGRWGIISREFLDVWNGKVEKESWNIHVEGIEAFPSNIENYHKEFYSKIWGQDARDFFRSCSTKYDLIIFGDVLEHFYKEEGYELLDTALKISDFIMINIPIGGDWEQDCLYGNDYEEHKSEWELEDFDKYSIVRKKVFKDFIGRDFVTVLLSSKRIPNNLLLYQHNIDEEIKHVKYELDSMNEYLLFLENKKRDSVSQLESILFEGELKILNSKNSERYLTKIRVCNSSNGSTQGSEVWIYHISSNEIPALDLKKVKKDGAWMIRNDRDATTGTCLIASQHGAEIEFEIIGDTLNLKCLSHPWSGCVEIIVNNNAVLKVDLYSKNQKIIDIIVNLKDVD
ncbi:hypothetical protein [Paenibacillus thiaminolyticus]|uniref:hypothetical protein n=1 Tax=Paenibacillus thiaminolyticus TaxID=49283 RepID=UPI0015FEFB94|nr:hypothetical protein [Paenibacillus thiaminolyticus]